MSIELPDPTRPLAPPSKMDKLALGPDCYRHPFIGNICTQNGGPPGQQARNYLAAILKASFHKTAGRQQDLTKTEYDDLLRRLTEWERTNSVFIPPPILGYGRPAPPPAPKPDNTPAVTKLVPSTDRVARDALAAAPTPSTAHH